MSQYLMSNKSRSNSFQRPPLLKTFRKEYKKKNVKLTVSPPPANFNSYCLIELQEIDEDQEQYLLDYSILYMLSVKHFPAEQKLKHQQIDKVLQLIQDKRFDQHFQKRGDCLLVKVLNLLVHPEEKKELAKTTRKKMQKTAQKDKKPTLRTLTESASLAFIAFRTIRFLIDFQSGSKAENPTKNMRMRNLSIREQVTNMILTTRSASKISHSAKLKIIGLFSFDLLETEYHHNLSSYYSQSRFDCGLIFGEKLVYNPTTVTIEIFRYLVNQRHRQRLLTGNGGIGKSFSITLLVTLSNYISNFNIENQRQSSTNFLDEKEQSQFQKWPKYYYISVGQYSAEKKFISIMKSQSHSHIFLNMNTQQIKLQNLVSHLDNYYNKINMQHVVIVDQINLYYSVLRKFQLQAKTKKIDKSLNNSLDILRYTGMFRECLLDSKFMICFSASANSEWKYNFNGSSQFALIKILENTQLRTVNFQHSNKACLVQIINMIFFELQKKLRDRKMISNINERFKQLDQLLHCDFSRYTSDHLFPAEINHFRVSAFVAQSSDLQNFKILDIKKDQQKNNHTIILNFEEKALNRVRLYCLNMFIKDFINFFKKGQNRPQKFQMIQKIKQYCMTHTDKDKIVIDIHNSSGMDLEVFQKEHLTVSSDGIVTIYYPPANYLVIIDQLFRRVNQWAELFRQFVTQFKSNNSLFGSLFDNCCTKLITSQNINLKIDKEEYKLRESNGQALSFEHFFEKKDVQYNILKKISALLPEIQKVKSTKVWVSAEPARKTSSIFKKYAKQSDNSRCIDCMMIRQQGILFQIKTFDFAMSNEEENIKSKEKNAEIFFTRFFELAKKQKLQISLEHLIIVRHRFSKCDPNVLTDFTIKRVSVKKFEINDNGYSVRSRHLKSLYDQLIKATKEKN